MKEIQLTRGKVAIVDDEDFEYLNQWNWYCSYYGYAVRGIQMNGKQTHLLMHRDLINTPKGLDTDHVNHDKLDNRKDNLRICTHTQNCRNAQKSRRNTSGFKGVTWDKAAGKWRAWIGPSRKGIHIGSFAVIEDAARAYDKVAHELFGEFASTNF